MRIIIFAFIVCSGILPLLTSGQTQCQTQFNTCVNDTTTRSIVEPDVNQEASNILNAIRTFANVGTGVYQLLNVPAGSRLPVGEVISDVFPDILRYFSNVNATYLEPYIANASQFIDDLVYDVLTFNLSNAEQSISNLVYTLDRGIDIVLDILRLPFNDPSIESIITQIESIRNVEGFLDNVTCILLNIIQDPNIEIIFTQSGQIVNVISDIKSLAAPITQLFRNSTRFMDKFEQIAIQQSTSSALQLCVDSILTNLICPQSAVCIGACTDTLRYCSALLFQSLDDFSDILDAVALLVFEEVKSPEFEAIYNDLIASTVEIVNTTLFALADLDYISLINNTIMTCRTEFIISQILQNLNVTIPPEQVSMLFSEIPDNLFENLTNSSDMFQNITQTILPYQNILYQIGLITLPNGFILNSLFSIGNYLKQIYFLSIYIILFELPIYLLYLLAIQNLLLYNPPAPCFDQASTFPTTTPLLIPFHSPNYFNCWNGTGVSSSFSFTFLTEIDSQPFNVMNNPAAIRTCSFSINNFLNAKVYTAIDLCDEFANVIFEEPRTANFLASILSNNPFSLLTCQFTISQLLSQANVTIPTTTSPPTMQPVDCISNECTNSTPSRPNITVGFNDGAEYIVETARTVANLGTSLSDFIDNINDRYALQEFLESTVPSVLNNLGGINDTDLRPLYGELYSFANDFFYHIFVNFSSQSTETVSNLIELLERGLLIGENLTRVIVGNDPNVTFIFDLINGVVSTPGFKDNLTCILTEVFTDPNIATILSQLESIDLTPFLSLSQSILQLFSDSEIFMDKFTELIAELPNSEALSFCVDSYLANLFCPFQSLYCQDNCVDTLNYCTSYLFYSLQDFSDVLDAVLLLAAGHVETPEFEFYFNQYREEVFTTTQITVDAFRTLDILGLVNTTLTNCNTFPLIEGIVSQFPIPGLPPLNSSDVILAVIDSILGELLANLTIPPTSEVIATLNQTIQLSGLRNLTRNLYFYPDGFLLNGVLSLGVYYIMRSNPPMGCGYSIGMQGPLSYELYDNFLSSCWNGEFFLSFSSIPNQFEHGAPYYDYSSTSIRFNQAALRTCSFSPYSYEFFAINTNTNLCTVFSSVDSQSRMILQDAVSSYGRLNYCRTFTGNFTSTTPTAPSPSSTTLSTTTTPFPIIAPEVSFQLNIYYASTNIAVSIICRGIGTDVQFSIDSMTDFTIMDPMLTQQQRILTFIFSTPGNYSLICRGSNPAGNSTSLTTIIVRSLDENLDVIANIDPDEVLDEEVAMELLSVTGSVANSEEVQNNATVAQQLANTASAIVSSLTNSTNISTDTASALLGLLGTVENSPVLAITPTQPPGTVDEAETLEVSDVTIMVSQAIDRISLNLANQAVPGGPPIIVVSTEITIAAAVVERTPGVSEFVLSGLPNTMVRVPLGSFGLSARIQIGAAQRSSSRRVIPPAGETVVVGSTPVLNSDLFNLNIIMNGIEVTVLTEPVTFVLQTSAISPDDENICTFLDEDTRMFVRGNVVTIPGGDAQSCETMHLTSFGVLVRAQRVTILSEAETLAISIVSYILLSISLIFLVVSLILFLISAKSFFKVETNILYFNYALSLALATSVFIFGIQSARNSFVGCSIVGLLMHYTWLSVFSWSFAISIFMIYVLYFGILNRRKIWWLMMIIGWGLPLPFVIITIAVGASRNQYVNIGDHCFLSYANGLIWAFLGPFIILIIASSVGAILAIIKIILTLRNKGDKPPSFATMVNLVVTILVLVPVLSVPWIIGIVNAFITAAVATTVIEWVTVLFTAPVGVLFFFIVVLRNPQVQEVIFRRKVTHVSQRDTQSSGTISSKYTISKEKGSEKFTESANVSYPTTFSNPTFESSTKVLMPGDEDSASKEKEALRKTYETGTTEKGGPKEPQNVYTALDTLATKKD